MNGKFDIVIYIAEYHADTTNKNYIIVGELDPTAEAYSKCVSDRDMAEIRLKQELDNKLMPAGTDKYSNIITVETLRIKHDKQTQADNKIHSWLCGKGYTRAKTNFGADTEFFEIESSTNFRNVFNFIKNGAETEIFNQKIETTPFILRENQKSFCERFINWYNSSNKTTQKFLLGALCRFGKTAVVLHILKVLGLKHILILSGMCDTYHAWSSDLCKFDRYIDVDNIEKEYKKYLWFNKENLKNDKNILKNNKNENIFCFISLQSGAKDYDETTDEYNEDSQITIIDDEIESFQNKLVKFNWDAIIIDECHFAAETDRTKKFIKNIFKNSPNAIEINISATPFQKLASKEYNENNSFIYTFIDEYNDYRSGKLNTFVGLNYYHINLLDYVNSGGFREINDKLEYKKSRGSFVNYNPVQEKIKHFQKFCQDHGFENTLYDFDAILTQYDNNYLSDFIKSLITQNFLLKGKNHIYVVNTIKQGAALEKMLINNCNFNKDNIFNCCGKNKPSLDLIDAKMKAAYENNEGPVICISCGRYLTGVTLTYAEVIVFFCKIRSAERFIQYACRAKNYWEGRKTRCCVFDLSPEAFITTKGFEDLIRANANYNRKSYSTVIKEFEKSINIFEFAYDPNYCLFNPKKNIAEEISEKFYSIENGSLICDLDLDDIKNIRNELVNISNENVSTTKTIEIGTNGFGNAKQTNRNKSDNDNDSESEKEKTINKKALLNALAQIKNAINYIPGFMKYHDITEVEKLFSQNFVKNCGKMTYFDLFKYWHNNFDLENLKIIKNYFIQNDQQYKWDNIVSAIQYALK